MQEKVNETQKRIDPRLAEEAMDWTLASAFLISGWYEHFSTMQCFVKRKSISCRYREREFENTTGIINRDDIEEYLLPLSYARDDRCGYGIEWVASRLMVLLKMYPRSP